MIFFKFLCIYVDAFIKAMKVTNYTGLWDAEILAWYSPNTSHRICLYGLEHSLGIHGFRFT